MDDEPTPDELAMQGAQSPDTIRLWTQVKRMRAYVRYCRSDGCFRSFSDAPSLKESFEVCWETLAQYERVLADYELGYEQVWLQPALVLVILCKPDQFITVRSFTVPTVSGVDLASARLLTLCATLDTFFGPSQPKQFESLIELRARAALSRGNDAEG